VLEVFLSYRTVDSLYATSAISAELARYLGRVNVFRDRDSLAPGSLYPKRIREAVARSDSVLAVIGPHWLDVRDPAGNRRIDAPGDWVRSELRTAFEAGIPVVPLLLDDTPLPARHQLPADIADLNVSTAWRIREQTLGIDVRALVDNLVPAAVLADPVPAGSGRYPRPR
jgi:hypothetical protein